MSELAFFRREWRAEAVFHASLVLVLALGFVMYALVYGAVSTVGAGSAAGAPELALPGGADAMVAEPAWLLDMSEPDYNLGPPRDVNTGKPPRRGVPGLVPPPLGDRWLEENGYDRGVTLLREAMPTEAGTVQVWGLADEAREELLPRIRLVAGNWPGPVGEGAVPEVALPQAMAARLGKGVGDAFWIGYARWPFGLWSETRARVSGIFAPESPVLADAVFADHDWLAGFTRLAGDNVLLAWGHRSEGNARRIVVSKGGPFGLPPTRLPSSREPMVPKWLLDGQNAEDGHRAQDLYGVPTPFAMTLGATVVTRGTPAVELARVGSGARASSTPLVLFVLALLVAAVTVMSVVRVLDRQRMLGIMKSVGFGTRDIRAVTRMAGLLDAAAGTALGILAFAALGRWLFDAFGARLVVTWTMAGGWVAVAAFLVWWQGAVVTILFHDTDARTLLLRSGRFDWWALLRFDLTKPAA